MESEPDEVISEKFSENTEPKRKRGRPRAFTPEFEQLMEQGQLLPVAHAERTHLNKKYFQYAFHVLRGAPNPERFRYLVPESDSIMAGKERFRRKCILSELGHLDEDDMLEIAEIVCREKWPTKEAIRRIRAWRLDNPILPEAQSDELAHLLAKTIDQYNVTHEGLTQEVLRGALKRLNVVADTWDQSDQD